MTTATWKARKSLIQGLGSLVLAGMVGVTGIAWAQVDCQLPAGVAPRPAPRVTAQEVEDGTATLTDFALAVRDRSARDLQDITTEAQAAYGGCLVRQEGSPWRSGSTYTVQLTPDGRVYVHAKDMSLSGRLLNPVIYGAVLQALGVDPSTLANPAAAFAALGAAIDGDGGLFEAAGFPGACGYAILMDTIGGRFPLVMLLGFDLVESHLVPVANEDIDYGAPEVEASDVVDRASLKDFVLEAEEHIVQLLEASDLAAASQAKIAFRDPEGPWRHGPVYLAVSERASRFIIFHGAFPDRFELRQGGIARDVATGELVVDQLFDAAESGPDGGFWLYHFDDPSDDTDSADTPKVGYARILTFNFVRPDDGTIVQTDYVINSGFYLTSDSVYVRRLLEALTEGQESIMFGVTAPDEGDAVSGDAVAVLVEGAPTDTVHFAYRLAGAADEPFTYAGAATNRGSTASFAWDTLGLPDDDYEFAVLYTEDDGFSVTYDSIEVTVDNVLDGGGGGCALAPVLAGGGPPDPTLPALVGLALVWLLLARRRLVRNAAMGFLRVQIVNTTPSTSAAAARL